ncbi:MAG: BamA/TamA family outer membrane protein [Proteobacteria bacterium]|jgi:outer membrane protein assembly factor BamA|nr:BamA/TamA family outer membrane protein [Pseudomonadota bacterium]
MSRLLTIALALLAPAIATAQTPPAPDRGGAAGLVELLGAVPAPEGEEGPYAPAAGPVEEQLIGLPVVDVRAVDAPSGFDPVADAEIPLGATFDRALVRTAVRRLWATGSYRAVEILAERRGDGAAIVVRVEALLRVHALEVIGNDAMSDDDVARAIGYTPDGTIEPTADALTVRRDTLLGVYADRGYRKARATLTVETTSVAGQVALSIDIDEGPKDRYVRITIRGLPEEVPLDTVLKKAELRPGTVRDRARVEESRNAIVDALAGFGYYDASVGDYEEKRLSEHAFALRIDIVAGLPSRLRFEEFRRFREAELVEVAAGKGRLRTTAAAVEIVRSRIAAHLVKRGLLHAVVRAERLCYDEAGRRTRTAELAPCAEGAARQEIAFIATEGVPVTVAAIVISGNSRIPDEELKREIVAFVASSNARTGVFQPINTRTVDSLGLSDPRPAGLGRPRGALSPTVAPKDAYVPEIYRAAVEHLTGVYRERGFLKARVVDTCDLATRGPMHAMGETYSPLDVRRDPAEGEVEEGKPCVFLNADRDLLIVAIGVEEGPQALLNRIAVEGNDPSLFTERDVVALAGLAPGQPYNEYRLRESARDVETAYGAKGRVFADVTWESRLSQDGTAADVVIAIREGPRAEIRRIFVRGNVATSRRLILDRLTIEPGDVITPAKLSKSEERLMGLGIFDSATVQMAAPNVASAEKNVVVQVGEGKPQYLELRGGVATVEGVRAGFEYGYRNVGGLAISARLRARANYRLLFPGKALKDFEARYRELSVVERLERHLLAGISTPHVPGTGGILGLGLDVINERTNSPAFSADRTSSYLRATSNRLKALPIELRTGIEWTTLDLPPITSADGGATSLQASPQFQKWALLPEGESLFSVTGLTVSLDFRDDVFNPSRGVFASINADYVRSLANFGRQAAKGPDGEDVVDPETGEVQYIDRFSSLIRAEASLSGYIPIIGRKMVLALSASVGYVFHLDPSSSTWADRYFYMGGVSTLRGFPEDSVVPEDIYQSWKREIRDYDDTAAALLNQRGGESMFLARAEFRFPLAKGFYGGVFTEAGNLWRDRKNLLKEMALRPVSGLGLRYMTPIGPLSFDLGLNLDKRPHEDRFAWYLSIGSAF